MATWRIGDWVAAEWEKGRLELLRYMGREQYLRVPERLSGEARRLDAEPNRPTEAVDGRVVAIGNGVFRSCGTLLGVVVPEGVLSIGAAAFERCGSLTSVKLPDSLCRMGEGCFRDCAALESVWLPERLTELPAAAFSGCGRLTSVNLDFVERIGERAFSGCTRLDGSRVNRDALHSEFVGAGAFQGCELLADETGMAVVDGMLTGCWSEEDELDVPEGVHTLDAGCLTGCRALRVLRLPQSLREIRDGALTGCEALTRVEAYGLVTRIGGAAFDRELDSLSSNVIAFERDEIDWRPFSVEGEGSFLVRGMQRQLPHNAFHMRFALNGGEITVLRYLGEEAQPRIPDMWRGYPVTAVGPYAFAGLPVTRVVLPKHLRELGVGAFAGDDRLRGIVVNGALRQVGAYAFAGCSSLPGVVFEDGLEYVDAGAFTGCAALRYARLPESLVRLAPDAFERTALLAGAKGGKIAQTARSLGFEFIDEADALSGRVVLDRYATYHMFVSGEHPGNDRWAFGGEVEGV